MNALVSISQHVLIFEPRWNCFRLGTQEQSGIPVVLFDRMIPNQATLSVLSRIP